MFCPNCGASDFNKNNGILICKYCGSSFQLTKEDISLKTSDISLGSDVDNLLQKCRTDPRNARKYANLILDIDPYNKEALKYL
ncbi:MAG: TFIIB-type zinc finger domain-containing protein [Clostridia bacterium]|nr:TFIIB-type zinc finger domain-containing protein [Clostridia bacterium]